MATQKQIDANRRNAQRSTGTPLVTDLYGPFSARHDEPDPHPNQPKLTPDQLLARAHRSLQ